MRSAFASVLLVAGAQAGHGDYMRGYGYDAPITRSYSYEAEPVTRSYSYEAEPVTRSYGYEAPSYTRSYEVPRSAGRYGYYVAEPVEEYGNDGYKVVPRSDPYEAPTDTINARVVLTDPMEKNNIYGVVRLSQPAGVLGHLSVEGEVWGVPPGEHGFHIHALGDLSEGCASIGGHYKPNSADGEESNEDDEHDEAHDLEPLRANYYGEA